MRVVDIILKKRRGHRLTKQELNFIIDGYVKDRIPDYQISALLMAICFQGLDTEEQVNLTMEMLESGEQVDLSSIEGICVDKHSTGGVGDKTTLVFAPIIASCGLKIAKMSGRGLGHTGGTLDKLESIPGFNINLSTKEFLKQVQEASIAVIGQTANITPADKKLYSLRDVTATVDNVGLIASSIMSKKLASGASSILLDVKVGEGAFIKEINEAKILAKAMVNIGNNVGRRTVAVLSNMDEPLGNMVGNSLEVIEAIETLKGNGPRAFTQLCYELASQMLVMNNLVQNKQQGLDLVKQKIESKEALHAFKDMIKFQGGDPNVVDDYSLLPQAKSKINVVSQTDGYVKRVDALKVGLGAMVLGAGRDHKDDVIDLGVGVEVLKKVGDRVKKLETLAVLYTNGKNTDQAYEYIIDAFQITSQKTQANQIILGIVE